MKATKLTIKNIGMIGDMTVEINKPLILFYGDIMQGKTTILNAVKYCFGGPTPDDMMKHGETEAEIVLGFEGGSCTRQWYTGKDGNVKARPVKLVMDGKFVNKPSDVIKRFMNPFLLNQDHLKDMSELGRQQYFTELFNIDTEEIDGRIVGVETQAKELRISIKSYGEIDLTEYVPVDVEDVRKQKVGILDKHEELIGEINEYNQGVLTRELKLQSEKDSIARLDPEILALQLKLDRLKDERYQSAEWIKENPLMEKKARPDTPDTTELDLQISDAAANAVRVEQYQANLVRSNNKKADEKRLSGLEKEGREAKKQKVAKLKEISASSGIEDLSFNESGNFTYMGTSAGMLSTSQIMKLSSELSALYPEGFGLDLIDRGESLFCGSTYKSRISEFVEKAEKENKTILATIVGEKPADIPEDIGVFVVEDGQIK